LKDILEDPKTLDFLSCRLLGQKSIDIEDNQIKFLETYIKGHGA
jgi:hypothetical protein